MRRRSLSLSSAIPKTPGIRLPENGPAMRGTEARALHGPDSVRPDLPVAPIRSIARKTTRLHRSRFYRLLQQRLCGRRFCANLRDSARSGTSCKISGITNRIQAMRGRVSESNTISFCRLELQADFLAGVWARYADRVRALSSRRYEERCARPARLATTDSNARGFVVPVQLPTAVRTTRPLVSPRLQTGDLSQGDTFNASSCSAEKL